MRGIVAAFIVMMAPVFLGGGCVDDDVADGFEAGEELPGGETTNTLLLGSNAFSRAAENISDEHELAFFSGNSFFNQGWVQAPSSTINRDGLGPVFNARSCAACHFRDGRGRPPPSVGDGEDGVDEGDGVGLLLRLSVSGGGPEPRYGGQLQPFGAGDVPGEGRVVIDAADRVVSYDDGGELVLRAPRYTIVDLAHGPLADDVLVSPRVAPQMIGLGLLEAISDEALDASADPDDRDGDGISGRRALAFDIAKGIEVTGRFGWKAEQPSVRQQSAGAFNGDVGITSALFPVDDCTAAQEACLAAADGANRDGSDDDDVEIRGELVDKVATYGSLLAPPVRPAARDAEVLRGKALFSDAGCAACHNPSWTTGTHPEFPELSNQLIWPYSDLLLHDMGEGLADGRPAGSADGREWRTPPLWGLGHLQVVNGHQRLLHDGRADGVEAAIVWHGGEAADAADAFAALDADERAALIAFVESL